MKQEKLLTEVTVSDSIKQNILSSLDVVNNTVVVDGGDIENSSYTSSRWNNLAMSFS